jgi:hypothetical protein
MRSSGFGRSSRTAGSASASQHHCRDPKEKARYRFWRGAHRACFGFGSRFVDFEKRVADVAHPTLAVALQAAAQEATD